MVGDFGWEHEGTECQVDTVKMRMYSRGKKDTPAYNIALCKWGHFDKAKPTFKMLLAFWSFDTVEKRVRTLNAVNMGSVGQRAAMILAVNVGGLKKKSANRPWPHSKQLAWVRFRSRSNHSQSLMAGNFAALWPTDSKFSALKDLILFSTVSKVQETGSILKLGFACSMWPHLHRAYLVTVPEWLSLGV